jgi:hypothetical protein
MLGADTTLIRINARCEGGMSLLEINQIHNYMRAIEAKGYEFRSKAAAAKKLPGLPFGDGGEQDR